MWDPPARSACLIRRGTSSYPETGGVGNADGEVSAICCAGLAEDLWCLFRAPARHRRREALVVAKDRRATTDERTGIPRFAIIILACWCVSSASGCGRPAPAPPLPQLHLPGVVRLDGLTRLQDQLGVHGISSLTTYFSAQLGAPARTHLVVGIGQGIYDLSLDGTAPIKLSTANICGGEISFTRDGRLAVCRSSDGIYAFPLTAAPAQPHMP